MKTGKIDVITVEIIARRGHRIVSRKRTVWVSASDRMARLGMFLARYAALKKVMDDIMSEEQVWKLDD